VVIALRGIATARGVPAAAGDLRRPAARGIALSVAVVVAVVVASPRGVRAEPSRPLVFVTLNLLHGGVFSGLTGRDERLERRLELVAAELRALAPDVVGLQEASTGVGRGNVAARLAAALGLEWAYAPASFRLTGWEPVDAFVATVMNLTEGPGILSRFPIAHTEVRSLPRCNGFFDPRVALRADLATPWGVMPVYSTHLSWGGCEAEELARFVAESRAALPSVLMGDFNAAADSPAIRYLTREAGMIDVFRTVEPGAPGLTVWQQPRAPARTVTRRVDYVFLSAGTVHRGRVLESRVVVDAPTPDADGTTIWPSDHYGVLAIIDVATGL